MPIIIFIFVSVIVGVFSSPSLYWIVAGFVFSIIDFSPNYMYQPPYSPSSHKYYGVPILSGGSDGPQFIATCLCDNHKAIITLPPPFPYPCLSYHIHIIFKDVHQGRCALYIIPGVSPTTSIYHLPTPLPPRMEDVP